MAKETKKKREGRLGIAVRGAEGISGMGSLEADIMAVIWNRGKVTVRDVYEELRLSKTIAYTTVMTVMKRLAEKKFLAQETSQTAYVYTPMKSKEEAGGEMLDAISRKLFGGSVGPLLQHLIGKASKKDIDMVPASKLKKLTAKK